MNGSGEHSPLVFWLGSAISDESGSLALGGKGHYLARLCAAGLPVPPGFVICAGAFPAQAPSTPAGPHEEPLPEETAALLAAAYAELGRRLGEADPLVAVRSSGLAEDLAEASFAGQYVTVLGARGVQDVIAAAARCQASLWAPGVAAYRAAVEQRTGKALPPPGMAVIVQALVPAEAAGVAETVDPMSGKPDIISIRAAWGLGRAVVDGLAQPDTWRVQRACEPASAAVLELRVGDKSTRVCAGPQARPEPVPDALRLRPCLSFEQAAEIAALALRAEAVVGGPADVEWALHQGKVWLLQARPLTGLPPAPAGPAEAAAAVEPEPAPGPSSPTPSFPFIWPHAGMAKYHWRREADDAHVFEALQPFELDARALNVRSTAQAAWITGAAETPGCLEVNGYLYNTQTPAPGEEAERKLRLEAHQRATRALFERGESLFVTAILPEAQAGTQRLAAVEVDALTEEDLAVHFEENFAWYEHAWTLHMLMDNWDEHSPVGRCSKLYGELTGEENPWAIFAPFGSAPQKDHEGIVGLIELARLVKGAPALKDLFERRQPAEILDELETIEGGPDFQHRFKVFLEIFGLVSGASQGILRSQIMPGWSEQPELAIAIVQRYLPQDLETLLAASRRSAEQYPAQIAELRQKVAASGATPEQCAEFDFLLAAVEKMILGVLDHNFYIDAPMNALMHRALLACGRRLAAAGAVDVADDVWWLRAHQVPAAVRSLKEEHRPDWRQLVAAQKALYAWQRSLTPPVYLGAPPPAPASAPAPQPEAAEELPANLLLRGEPAVPGVVTGRVRLVDYQALVPELQPGDIFVAPDCGVLWASLLPVAAAVVLEGSNPGEHAMRVCREFGVPGIVQAKGATRLLREGQTVTVDGGKGWILPG